MRRHWFVPTVLVLVLAGFASAQEANDGKKESDAGAMAPPPRPEALQAYEPLIGEWEGTYEVTEHMPGGPTTGKGRGKIAWDLDGRVVRWEGAGESSIGNYKYLTILAFDQMQGKHVGYTFDNMGFIDVATIYPDSTGRIFTMTSDGVDFATGAPAKNKTIMKFTDENTLEWMWYVTPKGSDAPMLMMKGVDKRK